MYLHDIFVGDDFVIKTSVTNSISAVSFDVLDDSCNFSDHMAIMSELEFMGDVKGKDTIETIRYCGYIWSDNLKRSY